MSIWGREFMFPDEESKSDALLGWVSREDVPDPEEAMRIAADDLGDYGIAMQAQPVLMREESEVEAEINGHEFPYWVECTKRAREPEPFWRIESVSVERQAA
jgi:hypothetical protein